MDSDVRSLAGRHRRTTRLHKLTRFSSGSVSNGAWASFQQFANLLFVGVFSVILARTVSVEDFGIYSYALSLAGIGIAIGLAGLYGLAIKEYKSSSTPGLLTVSMILVREITVLVFFVLLLGFGSLTSNSADEFLLLVLAGIAVFGRVLDVPELWYQAHLQARTPAIAKVSVAIAFFLAKCVALWLGYGILVVLLLYLMELLAASLIVLWRYSIDVKPAKPFSKPEMSSVLSLWRQSSPLLISGIAQQINLRAPIIVVNIMIGATGVAMLSVSQRITDICIALPMAYMTATFPAMLEARARRSADGEADVSYDQLLRRSFDGALWMGVSVALGLFLFADFIVRFVFGAEYLPAASLLRVQILAVPFMFMSAVFSKWIIAEGKLWISVGRQWIGAAVNITLCVLLIPSIGIVGAAWASSIGYISAVYLFAFLSRTTWPVAIHMTLAWFAPARMLYGYVFVRKRRSHNV